MHYILKPFILLTIPFLLCDISVNSIQTNPKVSFYTEPVQPQVNSKDFLVHASLRNDDLAIDIDPSKGDKAHTSSKPFLSPSALQWSEYSLEKRKDMMRRQVLNSENLFVIINEMQKDKAAMLKHYEQAKILLQQNPDNPLIKENITKMEELLIKADSILKKDYTNIPTDSVPNIESLETYNEIMAFVLANLNKMEVEMDAVFAEASLLNLYQEFWNGLPNNSVSEERKAFVETALTLTGKIPYEWGGKPKSSGWNKRWDTQGNGLDCSGFAEWAYWTYTGNSNKELRSTIIIADRQTQISYSDLQPGDLGMKSSTGTRYKDAQGNIFRSKTQAVKSNLANGYTEEEIEIIYNHVGIYIGKDLRGNNMWLHCAGGIINTVVVNDFNEFAVFYRNPAFD